MSNDWLPSTREGILGMAMKWNTVLALKGASWSVPEERITQLNTLTLNAQAAYNESKTKDRTSVITAKVEKAFKELVADLRDVKNRYYFVPPLTSVDLASLDLSPPDEIRTEVPAPIDTARGNTLLTVRYILTVIWEFLNPQDERANHGVRVNYGVITPDPEAQSALTGKHYYLKDAPNTPAQLSENFFTRRRKNPIEFPVQDSGKTVWFCLQVENAKGVHGPWGEMFNAVIP